MAKGSSQGASFMVGDGATPTEAFTEIPHARSIQWPGNPTPDIDVSDLGSTAREFVGGLPDLGEMSVEFLWDFEVEALHLALYTDFKASTVKNYRRVDPGGSIRTAPMYPRNIDEPRGVDEARTATVTFRISGDDTYTQS